MGGGGVDGAIHRAGGSAIFEECKKIYEEQGPLPTGKVVVTTAGNLKAKYVIHAVGPIWYDGKQSEPELLRNCYIESLKIAANHKCESVTFPSISTGAYGYPVDKAAPIALEAVRDFLKENTNIKEVRFVLFNSHVFNTYRNTLRKMNL